MQLPCSLLLHLQFHSPVNVGVRHSSRNKRFVGSKINKSHFQIQSCQCAVDFQYFRNIFCSFFSNLIQLCCTKEENWIKISNWLFKMTNLTAKFNVVNVLLVFNAFVIFFTPLSPIKLFCECWIVFIKLWCLKKTNLTFKYNLVNLLLIVNTFAMLFAPSTPIRFHCKCWISIKFHLQDCTFKNKQNSPSNPMMSMFCWLSMLLLCSLLLQLQFYCAVNVEF